MKIYGILWLTVKRRIKNFNRAHDFLKLKPIVKFKSHKPTIGLMAERKINMSIAEKVATQFNAQDASYIGLDGKLYLFRDIVSEAGGVFLRATTPDDEINSIYTNSQGWVFGFSDGSRIAIACGSEPVVLKNEGGYLP